MGGTALNATKLKVFEWEMQRESTWTSCYFAEAISRLYKHEYKFSYEKDDPEAMQFLENLRSFLISEHAFAPPPYNANLLEQEAFIAQPCRFPPC
jgi:hypothetical protein